MSLSEIIKRRRKELGYTLKDIADAMGVSEATVQRYESGNIKSLRHKNLSKLSEVLHVSPAQLMGWENDEPSATESETEDFKKYIESKLGRAITENDLRDFDIALDIVAERLKKEGK